MLWREPLVSKFIEEVRALSATFENETLVKKQAALMHRRIVMHWKTNQFCIIAHSSHWNRCEHLP